MKTELALVSAPLERPGPLVLSLVLPAEAQQQLAALIAEAVIERAQPAQSPVLLDRSELARALGVSVATVDRLVRDGAPSVRLVESRRFELAAVLEWLRTRELAK